MQIIFRGDLVCKANEPPVLAQVESKFWGWFVSPAP